MAHRDRVAPVSRWLLPILALLLVLGHTCEVPAYAALIGMSDVANGTHHAARNHDDHQEIGCDPVDGVASTGATSVVPSLAGAEAVVVSRPLFARHATALVATDAAWPSKPPLFLLHASLLI